jgi:hypothetical protein
VPLAGRVPPSLPNRGPGGGGAAQNPQTPPQYATASNTFYKCTATFRTHCTYIYIYTQFCLYFLRISPDLDTFRYGRFPQITVKVIPSFMKIDALNAIFGLDEERNLYPSSAHVFSDVGAIRYCSSAHSDSDRL